LTGHAHGEITINVAEADDAERERHRTSLGEPFRTLIGHFRHELGHYYWERLIAETEFLEPFRALFGDERAGYSECLQRFYSQGAPGDWPTNFVTAYASSHPWEDWAETWAHYLHMADSIETAGSFGLSLKPKHPQAATMKAEPARIPKREPDFDELLQTWMPITHVLNELNRGMGLHDLYPFVLTVKATAKLRFVHEVLTTRNGTSRDAARMGIDG
jgi:hypothetical protein